MATDRNAVFVDDHLSVPVLGERRLLVGLDSRRNRHRGDWPFDGWGLRSEAILRLIHGVPVAEIRFRRRIASALLDPDAVDLRPAAAAAAVEIVFDAPLYILARDPKLRRALAAEDGLSMTFDGPSASVFRVGLGG